MKEKERKSDERNERENKRYDKKGKKWQWKGKITNGRKIKKENKRKEEEEEIKKKCISTNNISRNLKFEGGDLDSRQKSQEWHG